MCRGRRCAPAGHRRSHSGLALPSQCHRQARQVRRRRRSQRPAAGPRLPRRPSQGHVPAPQGQPPHSGCHRRRLVGRAARTQPRAQRLPPASVGGAAGPTARRAASRAVRRSRCRPPGVHRPRREAPARASRPSGSTGGRPPHAGARLVRTPGACSMNRANLTSRAACAVVPAVNRRTLPLPHTRTCSCPSMSTSSSSRSSPSSSSRLETTESCAAGTGSVASVGAQGAQCPGAYGSF